MKRHALISIGLLLAAAGGAIAQEDRATAVRNDRKMVEGDESWIYDDLEKGIAAARRTGKPLLVVFR